jgi:meso-butanediol dehydrogenase / (S,S)-butanediol dehydrogenase / diacetyl reductase
MNAKVAVVTGGGSGIGAAIGRKLSAIGYHVVVTDLNLSAAETIATELKSAEAIKLDVTTLSDSSVVASAVSKKHGRLDLWVSNAGVSKMLPFTEITEEIFDFTMDVNLKGVFFAGQAAAKEMIQLGNRDGVIINIASMAGKQGKVPYLSDYVASKFGVVGLTQAMAFELAPHGIRVNSVCPGYVATPMQIRELAWEAELRGVSADTVRNLWITDTPLGRLEQPEDVANVVAFLASHEADFVTGEALAINGGAFMD